MEKSMLGNRAPWRPLIAAIGCCLLVACADRPASTAAQSSPQMAGAWYRVHFDSNSIDLDARGQMMVDKAAELVKGNGDVRVTVIGKSDRVGSSAFNMSLSERRAERVREALIGSGVSVERIDTNWLGEGKQDLPSFDNVTERRNRVVDVVVQPPY